MECGDKMFLCLLTPVKKHFGVVSKVKLVHLGHRPPNSSLSGVCFVLYIQQYYANTFIDGHSIFKNVLSVIL